MDRPQEPRPGACPKRAGYEITFPVVEGYAFALQSQRHHRRPRPDGAACVSSRSASLPRSSSSPAVGYRARQSLPRWTGRFREQDRQGYYDSTHLQTIEFEMRRQIVAMLGRGQDAHGPDPKGDARLRVQSRHQLFPQVLRMVHAYVGTRWISGAWTHASWAKSATSSASSSGCWPPSSPDDSRRAAAHAHPQPLQAHRARTAEVDFKTTRPCVRTPPQPHQPGRRPTPPRGSSRPPSGWRLPSQGPRPLLRAQRPTGLHHPLRISAAPASLQTRLPRPPANGITLILEIKGYEDRRRTAPNTKPPTAGSSRRQQLGQARQVGFPRLRGSSDVGTRTPAYRKWIADALQTQQGNFKSTLEQQTGAYP